LEDEGLKVDFRLRTEDVSEDDLPIAPGEDSPGVVERPGEVAVGIRDLGRIVEFGEAAGQAVDPSGFGDYEAGKQQIDGMLGVSIDDDVIAQLKGDTALSIGLDGGVAVRAELEDSAAFERTLRKVADTLPRVAQGLRGGEFGLAAPGRGEDLYRLTDSDGKNTYFGVVDEVFVLDDSAAGARRLASASPEDVPGARGSVVVSADAEKLAEAAISRLGSQLGLGGVLGGRLLTGPLGNLSGSVAATPAGLSGSQRLEID
jgi:hypothetical protein